MCGTFVLPDVEMTQSPIPREEIEVFRQLGPVEVIFDVGARTDTDYLAIHPEAEFHLFEPNPIFFEELANNVMNKGNVVANRIGLGDKEGMIMYNDMLQAFEGGAQTLKGFMAFPVYTLDWYVEENGVKGIDFLKIDTEGYDLNVLKGGKKALKNTKYIQYEHWDNDQAFHDLLGEEFDIEYIGYRNSLCLNKKLVPLNERARILRFIRENDYRNLK